MDRASSACQSYGPLNSLLNTNMFSPQRCLPVFILCCFVGSVFFAETRLSLAQESESAKPNIVLINIDDLGWMDLACQGSEFYRTPNVDRLASEGMRFTNAYAAAANCAPSRACLMTGQYGPRHGVYTVGNSDRGKPKTRKLIPTKNKKTISPDSPTLAKMLQGSGYRTASIGKWHISKDPLDYGVMHNIAGSEIGHPVKKLGGYHSPFNYVNCASEKKGEYLTDRLTDEAIKFIVAESDQPFFLYLPYYTVHTPLQAKEDKLKKWKAIPGKSGQKNAAYAAMIESMDENVGRLMACLEENKLAANTVVIFTSDNGGMGNVSRQLPLRAGKGSYFEGGIRVPLIVRWPGVTKAATECHEPVINLDFMPTFAAIAGADLKDDQIVDGQSMVPLLKDPTAEGKERSLFWHFPIYLQATGGGKGRAKNFETHDRLFRTRPGSVIRSGKWKLHEYFEDGRLELYDLEADVGETTNLIEIHPQVASRLHAELQTWRKETGAPVPTELNPKFEAQPERGASQ